MTDNIEIIYKDEYFVIINKPHGMLVHQSKISDEKENVAQILLNKKLGKRVHPAHRLDRKTSGLLVFGLTSEACSAFQKLIVNKNLEKKYLAIVRGFFPEQITVDYSLTNDDGKTQDAITHFKLLKTTELDIPLGKHKTSRYSLIEARPETGRMHQIRKHLNHLRHPIIGDRPHGCNKQNKLFKEKWGLSVMLLHAQSIAFNHPASNEKLKISAPVSTEFQRICGVFDISSEYYTNLNPI